MVVPYLQLFAVLLSPDTPGWNMLPFQRAIQHILPETQVLWFIVLYIVSIMIVLLLVFGLFYIGYATSGNQAPLQSILTLTRWVLWVSQSILYIPVHHVLLSVYGCRDGKWTFLFVDGHYCDEGQLAVIIINSSVVGIFACCVVTMTSLSFESNPRLPKTGDPNIGARTSNYQVAAERFFMTCIMVVWTFVPLDRQGWRAFTAIVYVLVALSLHIRDVPFYAPFMNQIRVAFIAAIAWTTLWFAIAVNQQETVKDPTYGPLIGLWIGLLPMAGIGAVLPRLWQYFVFRRVLGAENARILREEDDESAEMREVQSSPHRDRIPSGRSNVDRTTKDANQPVQEMEFRHPREVDLAGRMLSYAGKPQRARAVYERGLEAFPQEASVIIAHCLFLVYYGEEWGSALQNLRAARASRPSLLLRAQLHNMDRMLRQRMRTDAVGSEDMQSYAEAQKLLRLAKKYHIETIERMRDFWRLLLTGEESTLDELPAVARLIAESESRAMQAFQKLYELLPRNLTILRAYARFMEEVKSDPEAARELYLRAEEIEGHRGTEIISKQHQVVLSDSESGSPSSIGGYKKASSVHFDPVEEQRRKARKRRGSVNSSGVGSGGHSNSMGTGASSSRFGNNARQRRRFVQLRQALKTHKSRAIQLLARNVVWVMLICAVGAIVVFALVTSQFTTSNSARDSLGQVGVSRKTAIDGALLTYSMVLAAQNRAGLDEQEVYLELGELSRQYFESIDILDGILFNLYENRVGNYAELESFWDRPSIECQVFTATTEEMMSMNLLEAGRRFVRHGRNVAIMGTCEECEHLHFSTEVLSSNDQSLAGKEDINYMLKNAVACVLDSFSRATELYIEASAQSTTQSVVWLALILVAVAILLILLGILIFRPAFNRIQKERRSTLKLFMHVPKPVVRAVIDTLKTDIYDDVDTDEEREELGDDTVGAAAVEEKHAESPQKSPTKEDTELKIKHSDDAKEEKMQTGRKGDESKAMLRVMTIQYILALGAVLALFAVTVTLALVYEQESMAYGPDVAYSGERRHLVHLMRYDAQQLLWRHFLFHSYDEIIADLETQAARFRRVHYGLLFGDPELGLKGSRGRVPEEEKLLYEPGCLLSSKAKCRNERPGTLHLTRNGLDITLNEYVEQIDLLLGDVRYLVQNNRSLETFWGYNENGTDLRDVWATENPRFDLIQYLDDYVLSDALSLAKQLFVEAADSHSEEGQVWQNLMFIATLLLLLLLYILIFLPMIRTLHEEDRRTTSMLLMIPSATIDTVEVIRDYMEALMEGRAGTRKDERSDVVGGKTDRDVILDGLKESVVVVTKAGVVSLCNDPFMKMIGRKKVNEVEGTHFERHLVEDDRRWFTDTLRRFVKQKKDGQTPVQSKTPEKPAPETEEVEGETLLPEGPIGPTVEVSETYTTYVVQHGSSDPIRVDMWFYRLSGERTVVTMLESEKPHVDMRALVQSAIENVDNNVVAFDGVAGTVLAASAAARTTMGGELPDLVGQQIGQLFQGVEDPAVVVPPDGLETVASFKKQGTDRWHQVAITLGIADIPHPEESVRLALFVQRSHRHADPVEKPSKPEPSPEVHHREPKKVE